MNQAVDIPVVFEQETEERYFVKLPLAVMQPTDGSLYIEKDKLTEIIINDLSAKVAEGEAEIELHRGTAISLRGEVARLTAELTTASARLAGQQRLLTRLGGESAEASSAALQAKQEALELVGAQVVELQAQVADLEANLAVALAEVKATGDAAGRAADANARLKHSEEIRECLVAAGAELQRNYEALCVKVEGLTADQANLSRELQLARDGLARADVAKKNALDAQAAQFAEQRQQLTTVADGMTAISKSELASLRNLAKQVPDLEAALERANTKNDGTNEVLGAYRSRINHLEQCQAASEVAAERAAGLLKEMHGRCMAHKLDLDYTLMALRMFNNQPEYKSDSGRLTIMALSPEHLQSAESHTIDRNTPLCWWNTKGGLGCVTMLSAEPNEDGEHYLIFPSFSAKIDGVDGVVDVAKAVMPPKEEWPAIIEHMQALDSAQMTKAMDAGHEAALRYAHAVNPEALSVIAGAEHERKVREARAARRTNKIARVSKRKGRK